MWFHKHSVSSCMCVCERERQRQRERERERTKDPGGATWPRAAKQDSAAAPAPLGAEFEAGMSCSATRTCAYKTPALPFLPRQATLPGTIFSSLLLITLLSCPVSYKNLPLCTMEGFLPPFRVEIKEAARLTWLSGGALTCEPGGYGLIPGQGPCPGWGSIPNVGHVGGSRSMILSHH
uniref:Uncharacterized protein n=1 Tax=Pipistrellus kuhlii TaxID=59472 RepID=A0A7J7TW56_PIPKU|nr:hypothetical protein mPipKuh1_009275 [Pipistrellus kuhlii]